MAAAQQLSFIVTEPFGETSAGHEVVCARQGDRYLTICFWNSESSDGLIKDPSMMINRAFGRPLGYTRSVPLGGHANQVCQLKVVRQ